MKLLHGMDGLRSLPSGGALSIGNFDGVHLGHAEILRRARQFARNNSVSVVTFEPHPMTVLRPGDAPPRLADISTKRRLLEAAGVENLVELPPAPGVLGLSAENFWQIIRDDVRPRFLVEGADFHFGKGRGGNIATLKQWSANTDVELQVISDVETTLLNLHIVPVRSSIIRWLVGHGRIRDATICLGRPYILAGTIVEGFRRGRELGMPTANLRIDDQVIPMEGVYAGKCNVNGQTYSAAISVGQPPSFEDSTFQVEAHLIGFNGDLYGQTLHLEFLDWVRDQRKYASIDALKQQMHRDVSMIGSGA